MQSKGLFPLSLLLILAVASIMRICCYADFSYSNDEMSAINRLQVEGFGDLIEEGVVADYHPAFVQVFLYGWTSLFGMSEASVRFPFVLAGVLSVLFVFLVVRMWFGRTPALFSAAAFSFLQFPLLYSQLARPYSFGLLFVMMTTYFWTQLLFSNPPQRSNALNVLGLTLSAAASMYTHYFSFLTVLIILGTGLFFMRKTTFKSYLFSAGLAGLLFLPHLGITLSHMKKGGVGTWLDAPNGDFFGAYFSYAFNDSVVMHYCFAGIAIAGLLISLRNLVLTKYHFFGIVFFAAPLLIGYFYSLYINPVLQFSILLFSFPFLVGFVFSFLPEIQSRWRRFLFTSLFLIIGVHNTVAVKAYYHTQHFGVFKELAVAIGKWEDNLGEENISKAIHVNAPYYIQHYLERLDVRDTSFLMYHCTSPEEVVQLKDLVKNTQTPYFVYGWSTVGNPLEAYEVIMQYYPYIEEDLVFFNSRITLFSKTSGKKRTPLFSSNQAFEVPKEHWKFNTSLLDTQFVSSEENSFRMDSTTEYGAEFNAAKHELGHSSSMNLVLNAKVFRSDSSAKGEIVYTLIRHGETIHWFSSKIETYASVGQWDHVVLSRKLPDDARPTDQIKVYIWNTGKGVFHLDDFQVRTYHHDEIKDLRGKPHKGF